MSQSFQRASEEEIVDLREFLNQDKERFQNEFNLNRKSNLTIQSFGLCKLLGSGSFGQVFLARLISEDKLFAIKIMRKKKLVETNQLSHVCNERRILQAVNFPFIIYLNYYFQDNSNVYFVMPFIMGGELFNLIKKSSGLNEELSKFYAVQVVLAIEYLHNLDLAYRDLKPENILIDITGYIKLVDFGFCKKINGRTYTLCGTPEYIAPELLLNKGYGFSVDWWALGILIYEMNHGQVPFQHVNHIKLYEKIIDGKYSVPSHFSNQLQDLIKNLLQVNLSKRYGCLFNGVNDIKFHEWFSNLDWTQILNRQVEPPHKPDVNIPVDVSIYPDVSYSAIAVAPNNEYPDEFKEL